MKITLALFPALSWAASEWTDFISSCKSPQGLENGQLKNGRFSASSSHYSTLQFTTWLPHKARLNYNPPVSLINAWMPEFDEHPENSYLQVDLGSKKVITGIATQGASRYTKDVYVTKFKLEYSLDGDNWLTIQEKVGKKSTRSSGAEEERISLRRKHHKSHVMTKADGDLVFYGNKDNDGIVVNYMPRVIVAQYIRFRPVAFHKRAALRMELYGCDYDISMVNDLPKGDSDVFTTQRLTQGILEN